MDLLDRLRRLTTGLVVAGLMAGGLAIGGCSESEDGSIEHTEQTADEATRVDVYEGVLGELKFVPGEGDVGRGVEIRHMQIPEFKREDGTVAVSRDGVAGMKSMAMEFPLADGVSVDGYGVGDKIRFSFRVFWGERLGFEITRIEKLDDGVEIDFTNVTVEP